MNYNNEYFVLRLITEAALLMIAGRSGKIYLYALMTINLLLVPVFGQKLFEIFGIITNGGNVFYATAILCLAMLIEKYGMTEFKNILGYAVFSMVGYIIMANISHYIIGTNSISEHINIVFSFVPRIMLASLSSFIISACAFVWMYNYFKKKFPNEYLFRLINTVVIVQFIDSMFFFILAFWGEIPYRILAVALLYGFLVKSVASIVLIPFVSFGLRKSISIKNILIKT